jgi:hypothetical protein
MVDVKVTETISATGLTTYKYLVVNNGFGKVTGVDLGSSVVDSAFHLPLRPLAVRGPAGWSATVFRQEESTLYSVSWTNVPVGIPLGASLAGFEVDVPSPQPEYGIGGVCRIYSGDGSSHASYRMVADDAPPFISITTPTAGQVLSGTTTVVASTTDGRPITSVQFQMDGSNVSSPITSPPFSLSWNTTLTPDGNHALSATALDSAGNTFSAPPIQVVIHNSSADIPVAWTSVVGVSVNGAVVKKTAASGWGNAGAISTQTLVSGDGYVEATASETTTYRMFGISSGDSNQTYTDVDFGIYLEAAGGVMVNDG